MYIIAFLQKKFTYPQFVSYFAYYIKQILLVKILARLIYVSLVIANATYFKQAGNVLEDAGSMLYTLSIKLLKDIERTQHGIVYIDEIDNMWKNYGIINY